MTMNPFSTELFRNLPEEGLTTLYQNPRIHLPFDPKDLAMFVDRRSGVPLRGLPYHHRSADLGVSTLIHEKRPSGDNVFLQFDVKGCGFLFPETHESKKVGVKAGDLAGSPDAHLFPDAPETPWGYDSLGLMDERTAMRTLENIEKTAKLGMRTEGVVGVYRTDKIFLDGKEVSVASYKKEAIQRIRTLAREIDDSERAEEYVEMTKDIQEMFDPVIFVRVMRSIFRLRDFRDASPEQKQAMLTEACQNVNYEQQALGMPERFEVQTPEGTEKFFKFIFQWHAKNAGLMHHGGLTHLFLHMGNLSLAGEIVDLDSLQPMLKKIVYRGKPDQKNTWDEKQKDIHPIFTTTPQGGVCVNPDTAPYRTIDPRFGLPKCMVKDMRDICFSIRLLMHEDWVKQPEKQAIHHRISEQVITAYRAGLGDRSPLEAVGISLDQIMHGFRLIAEQIIDEDKKMSPIEEDETTV